MQLVSEPLLCFSDAGLDACRALVLLFGLVYCGGGVDSCSDLLLLLDPVVSATGLEACCALVLLFGLVYCGGGVDSCSDLLLFLDPVVCGGGGSVVIDDSRGSSGPEHDSVEDLLDVICRGRSVAFGVDGVCCGTDDAVIVVFLSEAAETAPAAAIIALRLILVLWYPR